MTAWRRLAMALSDPFISATFSSRAFSPSALAASAFSSLARSFIAARSSAVNPLPEPVRFVVARLVAVLFSAISSTSLSQFLDAEQVARGIAEGAVAEPVRLVDRLLDDLGALRLDSLEGAVEVLGGEEDPPVRAFGHHLGDGAPFVVGDAGV